jgi:hypothetical protein
MSTDLNIKEVVRRLVEEGDPETADYGLGTILESMDSDLGSLSDTEILTILVAVDGELQMRRRPGRFTFRESRLRDAVRRSIGFLLK